MSKPTADEKRQPAQKRSRPDCLDITTVLVGESEEAFLVHTRNICDKSPYFEAACSKKWREGQEQIIRLPTVEVDIFKIYLHWVYSSQLDIDIGLDNDTELRVQSFCSLYITADMFLESKLKHRIIDTIREQNLSFDLINVQDIWKKTPRGYALQR